MAVPKGNDDDLILALEKISEMASRIGASVIPFESKGQILDCPPSIRAEVLSIISETLKVYADTGIEPNTTPENESLIFQAVLRNNKYKAMDDVEKYYESGDIVEIYNLRGIQKYRNMTFLKFCSFDLFTLYSRPFIELYERGKEFDQQVMNSIEQVVKNPKGTVKFNCAPHLLKEKYLNNRKVFQINPKWISPLIGESGNVEAVVLTNYCIEHSLKSVD